jgi:hypothetical protein
MGIPMGIAYLSVFPRRFFFLSFEFGTRKSKKKQKKNMKKSIGGWFWEFPWECAWEFQWELLIFQFFPADFFSEF